MVMNFLLLKNFLALNLILILIVGCGGSSGGSQSSQAKDFNKSTLLPALKNSVLTIPENIQLVAESSSGKKLKNSKQNKDLANNGLGENIYGSITSTIKHSETIKNNILAFLEFIFEEKGLDTVEIGTLIETEQGTITAYKLEDLTGVEGETYRWKLSLYFFFRSEAEIICRFTFINGKMKGQMLQSFDENFKMTVGSFSHTIYKYFYYDIKFDGTSSPQKLDVDYVVDLSQVIRFAEQYWFQLTDEEFDSLELSQTGKSSIRVQFDGIEYGISGTNYAPGANTESLLRRQVKIFGDDRSTYSFRAKSITGAVDGAKMEVALPLDELEDVSTIWETDSFAQLFEEEVLGFLREYINQLIDDTDDEFINNSDYLGTAILNSVNFDGTPLEEQRIGFNVLYYYLKNEIAIPSLATHGNVISETEFDAAVAFWGSSTFTDFSITSLTELNAFLESTDITITSSNKEEVYYQVMAPVIIDYYQTNPIGITISQVETVLEEINDINSLAFKSLIETNKLIVNPAFFEKETGFLGTYDGTNFNVYDWFKDSLSVGEKPTNFDTLNALDLTDLDALIPKTIKDLEIEVK